MQEAGRQSGRKREEKGEEENEGRGRDTFGHAEIIVRMQAVDDDARRPKKKPSFLD